jgi:ureidoglycolate dehydrogenase (NAD+)
MANYFQVNSGQLEELVKEIFIHYGTSEENALIISRSLVDADLNNVSSHGVMRVSHYIDRIMLGGTVPNPEIRVIKETPTTALIDGANGPGPVAAEIAVKMAREKAKKNGMAFISVRNGNHYGAAGRWARMIAGNDLVGMSGSNVQPAMCAFGGTERAIGNNPFAYAFPTESYGTLCLDIACCVMAGGKMLIARLEGKQIPPNCFLDAGGKSTTDPNKAEIFVPFAGHKGYGLAVFVEMLCSVMSGGGLPFEIGSQYTDMDKPNLLSFYFMAINPDLIRGLAEFKSDSDRFVEYLHGLRPVEGVNKIYFPGELENLSKEDQLKNGIRIIPGVVEDLKNTAEKAGLSPEKLAFLPEHAVFSE